LPIDFVTSVRRTREAGVPADFVAGVRARSESAEVIPEDEGMVVYTPPSRRTQPSAPSPQSQPVRRTPVPARPRPATPVDTFFGLPSPYIPPPVAPAPAVTDTVRRDTLVRPRPDSLVVRDTLPAQRRL
ncbi:MAG: hypothetical protein ACREOK_03755, partial [Gemmatimonadaceae bacterium]